MRLRFVLASFLTMVFLMSPFSTFVSRTSPDSSHGCAPLTPPPVTGTPLPAPSISGKFLINEVLSLPGSRWNCSEPLNTYSITNDSWIELYNTQNQPYNLYASHATFEIGSSTKPFYLPLGSVIAPHGYLVLFPSMFSGTLINNVVRLLIGGITIDQINIPSLPIDQSYARIPDGSNSWQFTNTPTIDTSNSTSQPDSLVSPTVSSPNQGSAGSGNPTSTPAPISGKQIVWSNLHFPTPPVIASPITNSTVASPSSSLTSMNDGRDTPHRILISALVIVLASMLVWYWRLFLKV